MQQSDSRRMFPRWRLLDSARRAGELGTVVAAKKHMVIEDHFFEQRLLAWKTTKNDEGLAAELLSHALLLDRKDVVQEVLVQSRTNWSSKPRLRALLEDAGRFISAKSPDSIDSISAFSPEQARSFINLHRRYSRLVPRDAVSQIEMAWHYTVIGRLDKAERCMQWALGVATNNRYVVRSACRFYVHRSMHDRAKKILVQSGLVKTDPWIAAALVAVDQALRQTPSNLRPLQELGLNKGLNPIGRSELLAALADFHNGEGNRKKTKALYTEALQAPSDNALAQGIAWMGSEAHPEAEKVVQLANVRVPFEAEAVVYYYAQHWDECLKQTRNWRADQPFSGRPYIFESYVLSVIKEDFEQALKVLELGMICDPDDPTMKNNKAFSLINLGRYNEARTILTSTRVRTLTTDAEIADFATRGLLKYRTAKTEQDVEDARELYAKAINLARKHAPQKTRGQSALMFQLMEEMRLGFRLRFEDVTVIDKILQKTHDPGVSFLAKKVRSAGTNGKLVGEIAATFQLEHLSPQHNHLIGSD